MKQKILAFVLGMLMLTSGSGLIYARSTASVTNNFEFGVVDIRLEEYQIRNGKEVSYPKNKTVYLVPGMVISQIPRIYNEGADCYVRAKLTFRNTDELDETSFNMGKNWKLADDGYWYYTKVLSADDDVDIFSELHIPDDFSQEAENDKIRLNISVDAIQAENFEPNFKRAKPWGNTKIVAYEEDRDYEYRQYSHSNKQLFTVTYDGDAGTLVTNQKDFFTNMPALMPGDEFSDSLTIRNNGKNPIKLYFSTKYNENDLKLLEKLHLTINKTIDGTTTQIYDGNLAAQDLSKSVLIKEFAAGETGTMSFTISVPKELTNEYALRDSDVTWTFSSDEIIPDKPGDNTNDNNNNNSGNNNNNNNNGNNSKPDDNTGKGPSNNGAPQTGDTNTMAILLAIFISSAAGLLTTILFPLWKKKKEAGTHETE